MTKVKTSESDCKTNDNMHSFVKNDGDFHPQAQPVRKDPGGFGNLKDVIQQSLDGESMTEEKVLEIARKVGLENYKKKDTPTIAKELGVYELFMKN